MLECSLKIELRFDNYTLYKLLFIYVRYSKRPRLYVLNGYLKFLRWNFWGKKVHDKGLIIKIILSQFHSSHQPEARLKRHHIISRQFLYSVLHNRGQWLVHWSLIKIVTLCLFFWAIFGLFCTLNFGAIVVSKLWLRWVSLLQIQIIQIQNTVGTELDWYPSFMYPKENVNDIMSWWEATKGWACKRLWTVLETSFKDFLWKI